LVAIRVCDRDYGLQHPATHSPAPQQQLAQEPPGLRTRSRLAFRRPALTPGTPGCRAIAGTRGPASMERGGAPLGWLRDGSRPRRVGSLSRSRSGGVNDAINRRDLDALGGLITEGHTFIDSEATFSPRRTTCSTAGGASLMRSPIIETTG
jgi:hypothetical protein